MSGSIVCCCSSPDCVVNGCALYRRYQEEYRPTEYFQSPTIGWTCPNCGTGNAPGVETCPHCRPLKVTCSTIETP